MSRQPGQDRLDAGAVIAFLAAQVAPYKRVRVMEIVPEIPKSPSGKLLRRLLRDRERAARQEPGRR